jgi:hypothetical protein
MWSIVAQLATSALSKRLYKALPNHTTFKQAEHPSDLVCQLRCMAMAGKPVHVAINILPATVRSMLLSHGDGDASSQASSPVATQSRDLASPRQRPATDPAAICDQRRPQYHATCET